MWKTQFAVMSRFGDGSAGVEYYATAADARQVYNDSVERNADGFLHPHFLLVIDGRPVEGKQL